MTRSLVALALVASALPAVSVAQTGAESFSVAIPYGDLNLTTANGQERLASRIRAAADRSCGYFGVAPLAARQKVLECRARFIASARVQSDRAIALATNRQQSFAATGR